MSSPLEWNGDSSLFLHWDRVPVREGAGHAHLTLRVPLHTQCPRAEEVVVPSEPIIHRRLVGKGLIQLRGCGLTHLVGVVCPSSVNHKLVLETAL